MAGLREAYSRNNSYTVRQRPKLLPHLTRATTLPIPIPWVDACSIAIFAIYRGYRGSSCFFEGEMAGIGAHPRVAFLATPHHF